MIQNDVLLKCAIPSFVSDFVSVEAWVDSEAETFYTGDQYGTELKLVKVNFLDYSTILSKYFCTLKASKIVHVGKELANKLAVTTIYIKSAALKKICSGHVDWN